MPTYDYRCKICRSETEVRHPVNEAAPRCPDCGGGMEKIILSAPAVHGYMAQGREQAMKSLCPPDHDTSHRHGPGCGCGGRHDQE